MKTKKITVTQAQLNTGEAIIDLSLASPSFNGFDQIQEYNEYIYPNTITFTNSSGVSLGYVLLGKEEKIQYDNENFSFIQISVNGSNLQTSDSTGLANDATAYTANVIDNQGNTTAISITGSAAQTYTDLITELNTDLTGVATASFYGSGSNVNGIKILSDNKTHHIRIEDSGSDPLLAGLGLIPSEDVTYADYKFTPLTVGSGSNFEGNKLIGPAYIVLTDGGSATSGIAIECSDYHRSNRL